MDDLTRGTWIVNSIKHILSVKTNTPELSYFEATELSGKSGTLLARLVADEQEIIPAAKVKVLARESGITSGEITTCLDRLKQMGKIDFTTDQAGSLKAVEIYCFSVQDALLTTSHLYDYLGPSEHEQASLISLDSTFQLPRYKSEIIDTITTNGFSEETAFATLGLQDALELIKTSKESSEPIYYNEYAFAGNPENIARALRGLSDDERKIVTDTQVLIEENPGYSLETLSKKIPSHMLKLMEGVGLIDATTVHSTIGDATFLTLPQLKGISIGTPALSIDVFHKAKVLLSCLRFGEIKSHPGRGRIDTYEKMVNIVNKLVRGNWVGPCTAIGHDYQLLERDGVVETMHTGHGLYMMKLRQREVGILVKHMLEFNRVCPEIDVELQKLLNNQPIGYTMPEHRRSQILAMPTKAVKGIRERLLQTLRTGIRQW